MGQAKADIGYAQCRATAEALLDHAYGAEQLVGFLLVCRDGHGEAVDDDVARRDAIEGRLAHDVLPDGVTLFSGTGYPVLVESEADDGATILCCDRQDRIEALPLAVDGIDERFARV